MKSNRELKNNVNSACNVVSLQSNGAKTVPESIRDGDLIIEINSDVPSCDYDDGESDIEKTYLPAAFNFEQDIEKLIEVSKQFQTDYENDKLATVHGVVVDDAHSNLDIQILTSNSNSLRRQKATSEVNVVQVNDDDNYYFSNCSSRKENALSLLSNKRSKTFTPKLPNPGPFETGIVRPSPKKHSCVQRNEITSLKRTYRAGWNVRPYTAGYYNFDRTHPDLQLVDNGGSMIPKRMAKESTRMTDKPQSMTVIKKPLMNKGLTWHEFFERSNVYSAKSVQSSYGGDPSSHTTATQTAISESLTPQLSEISKIQKHILPQLNIRAECCVQRIPEISIAPDDGLKQMVKSNIKLVEIVYEESGKEVQSIEASVKQIADSFTIENQKVIEEPQVESNLNCSSSIDFVEPMKVNENAEHSESKVSGTHSAETSSDYDGYDSSLEESISLNVSALTSAFTDHDIIRKPLKDKAVQTQKLKRFAKHRKDKGDEKIITTSSDYSEFEYDGKPLQQPHQIFHELELPTFPTDELIQMVDEIFDTSSDAVNMSCKYFVKETSVQTNIVWENINALFKQQNTTIKESRSVVNQLPDIFAKPDTLQSNFVNGERIDERQFQHAMPPEAILNSGNGIHKKDSAYDGYCRHKHLKKFEICSCLVCKNNIRFSAVNINQVPQRVSTSGDSSASSAVFQHAKPSPRATNNLFPSERYKRMKQAQREHFENDPRISKTLKKIYETAKTIKDRNDITSSGSSDRRRLHDPLYPFNNFSSCDDDVLQPDLFTFNDEVLLFGFRSSDDVQYSSHLLQTESSQDTFQSKGRYCGMDASKEMFHRDRLLCTNSEDSSGNSFLHKQGSDLERCLLKDIENSGSDPAALSSVFSTSSLERKVSEIQLDELKSI